MTSSNLIIWEPLPHNTIVLRSTLGLQRKTSSRDTDAQSIMWSSRARQHRPGEGLARRSASTPRRALGTGSRATLRGDSLPQPLQSTAGPPSPSTRRVALIPMESQSLWKVQLLTLQSSPMYSCPQLYTLEKLTAESQNNERAPVRKV